MPKFELLSQNDHRQLRMAPVIGDMPHFVQIVIGEIIQAAQACPVMLSKDPENGAFYIGAVLSLKPGEAPLKDVDERGGFKPLSRQCNGFYVSGEQIAIDRENSRFSTAHGDELFDSLQQPTDALRMIQTALGKYHAGMQATVEFIKAMTDYKLIEPVDLNLAFDNGEKLDIRGLYTISQDKLRELDDNSTLALFRSGHLQLAYAIAWSVNQFGVLANLRNRRLKQKT